MLTIILLCVNDICTTFRCFVNLYLLLFDRLRIFRFVVLNVCVYSLSCCCGRYRLTPTSLPFGLSLRSNFYGDTYFSRLGGSVSNCSRRRVKSSKGTLSGLSLTTTGGVAARGWRTDRTAGGRAWPGLRWAVLLV